jgi:hypothetical protein
VELEKIHAVTPQPSQALVKRCHHRIADPIAFWIAYAYLGAHQHICPQRAKHLAKVTLGLAGTVISRRVKIIDAPFECRSDSSLLFVGRAADHQPSDSTAAKPSAETESPVRPSALCSIICSFPVRIRERRNLKRHPVKDNTACESAPKWDPPGYGNTAWSD